MTEESSKSGADDFNPQDYVRGLERGDVQFEPERLLEWLQTRRVFFYPAAGLEDWYSLRYFSSPAAGEMQCDLFVFCDWGRQAADFEKTIWDREQLNRERPASSHLKCSAIEVVKPEHLGTTSIRANFDFLTEEEKAAYQAAHEQFALREGWGRLAEIVSEDQNGTQRFPLLFLGAEGVATYINLFVGKGIIPHVICIKNPGVGFGCGWTEFNDWKDPLARAVVFGAEQCGSEPKYLATDRVHNWPWTQIVYRSQGLTVHKRPEPCDAVAGVKKVLGAEKRIQTWPFFVQQPE